MTRRISAVIGALDQLRARLPRRARARHLSEHVENLTLCGTRLRVEYAFRRERQGLRDGGLGARVLVNTFPVPLRHGFRIRYHASALINREGDTDTNREKEH
jgi:hypothetical protein